MEQYPLEVSEIETVFFASNEPYSRKSSMKQKHYGDYKSMTSFLHTFIFMFYLCL